MRKLAPMIIISSFAAFATSNVLAGGDKQHASTDKHGNPTVSANKTTNKDLSYSDKSNTAKGTNAKIGDDKVAAANGSTAMDTSASAQNLGETRSEAAKPYDEDNKQLADKNKSDKPMKKKVAKAKVDKDATIADASTTGTMASGTTVAADTPAPAASNNPPLTETRAEEAKSTTGKSGGQ